MDQFENWGMRTSTIIKVGRSLYEAATGERFEVDSAIRHYPLLALGIAAGAGALGGYWLGQRSVTPMAPPLPQPQEPASPLPFLDDLIPGGLDRVRDFLPEGTGEDALQTIRTWIEPRLKEGLESVVESAPEGTVRTLLQEGLRYFGRPKGQS